MKTMSTRKCAAPDRTRNRREGRIVMILSNPAANDPRVGKEAAALAAVGHDVTIVAWDRTGAHPRSEERDGYTIERVSVPSTFGRGAKQIPALLRFFVRAAPQIRRLRPAVIHCHDLETLPAGLTLGRLLRSHVLFDAHEPNYYADARTARRLVKGTAKLLERTFVPRADAVLVTNDYQRIKYTSRGVRRIRIVANYPDEHLLRAKPRFRDSGPLTIGRIGALYHDMGIEALVGAHEMLRKEFPDLRLLFAGQSTKEYSTVIERLVRSAGESVTWTGPYGYDELPSLYDSMDVCVLPQRQTAWFRNITPTKFFEVLCMGKPVVTTDIGGIGEIVRRHRCGTVLGEVSPEAIRDALHPLLRSASLRKEMGARGAEAVREHYSWKKSEDALLAAYASLTAASSGNMEADAPRRRAASPEGAAQGVDQS